MVRLPCCLRREVVSEESSHSKDHETHGTDPNDLKSSSNDEETKPLMAANSSYGGHGSINYGSFTCSINSTEGVDSNHIHLIPHTSAPS